MLFQFILGFIFDFISSTVSTVLAHLIRRYELTLTDARRSGPRGEIVGLLEVCRFESALSMRASDK
jgi:hypothetical protein